MKMNDLVDMRTSASILKNNIRYLFALLFIFLFSSPITCFVIVPNLTFQNTQNALSRNINKYHDKSCPINSRKRLMRSSTLYSSSGSSNGTGDSGNLDMMRQLLEASWNVDSMGVVPSTPENAAEAAATAVSNARDNNDMNLLLIDILLPSYDITQGENLYDEILAAEFCIALANSLKTQSNSKKTAILVKNGRAVRTVEKILDIKEQRRLEEEDDDDDDDDDDYDDDDDEEDDIQVDTILEFNDDVQDFDGIGSVMEFNDFDDFGSISSFSNDANDDSNLLDRSNSNTQSPDDPAKNSEPTNEIDDFRAQLMSNWDEPNDNDVDSPVSSNQDNLQTTQKSKSTKKSKSKSKKSESSTSILPKSYRIGSLLGDKSISQGPDMFDDVIAAVDENAVPVQHENEDDTLIILSAATQEEMIAVRRLIAKYKSTKTLIFVNCKLDPMPREMIRASTVYSILPLIAKPVVSETNILAKNKNPEDTKPSTKVVLMRRFPRDWELFADLDGSGFEMIDSIPASAVPTKGPSSEWIASCVKKYMRLKFNGD